MLLGLMAAYGFCIFPIMAQQERLTINLQDAMERARINSPQFQSSSLEVEIAHLDRYLAKTDYFPTAGYLNQYVYTQGNGTPSGVFIGKDV